MIDYEKLKIAHELADRINFSDIQIKSVYGLKKSYFVLTFDDDKDLFNEYEFKKIDDLIIKLKELLGEKSNTKYQIGQTVWRLNDEYKPVSFKIADIDQSSDEKYLEILDEDGDWWTEEMLYSSKDELINDQIKYWIGLKNEKKSTDKEDVSMECRHESDGTLRLSNPPLHACKKCGEFYR